MDATAADGVFEELANAAVLECIFAGCFPPSDFIAKVIPLGVGGPVGIGEASSQWREGADGLQQLQEQLRSLTEALPADAWTGDDRDGFDKEVSDLLAQFGDSHNTAEAIGIALEVLPPFFAVWPTMALTMGSGIAIIAASFYAAAFSGIGDITGVSEEIYTMGLEFSGMCLEVINVANEVLITTLLIVQGVLATAVFADIDTQQQHGNDQIAGDLGQAEVDGLGEVAANAIQFGFSKALDRGADHFGGEAAKPPPVLGSTLGGLIRGEGRLARVGAHAVASQLDVTQHQVADRTGGGERLQDLINDMSGWAGQSEGGGGEGSGEGSGDGSGDSGDQEEGG